MMNSLRKINFWLLLTFLFLLPWQTRLIYKPAFLNGPPATLGVAVRAGGFWEYGSLSLYGTELLLGLILILAIIQLLYTRPWQNYSEPEKKSSRQRLFIGLLFLGLLLLTIPVSRAPAVSAQWVGWVISGAAAALLLVLYQKEGFWLRLAFWLGGAGQGILGIWQFVTQEVVANKWLGMAAHAPGNFVGEFVVETASGRWLRAYGSFGSPNMLGGYLAVVFVVGLGLYLKSASSRGKVQTRLIASVLAGQMIILSGLVLSFSRGAWIAAGAGVLMCIGVLVRENRWREKKKNFLKIMMYSAVVLAILVFFFAPLFTARITATGRLENKSLATRTEQYSEWAGVFKNENLFLGVGPGAYTAALFQLNPARPGWAYQPVHNVYLLVLAEIGIVGFTIVLLFFCFLVGLIKKINPAGLPVLVVVLTGFLFDHFWWSLSGGVMLVGVVAGFSLVDIYLYKKFKSSVPLEVRPRRLG